MIKRKRYIVNWRFQVKYILFGILPTVALGILSIFMISNYVENMLLNQKQALMTQISSLENFSSLSTGDYLKSEILMRRLFDEIKNLKLFTIDLLKSNLLELNNLNRNILFATIVLIFGSLFLGILYSHRIAGPIFRIQKELMEVTKYLPFPIKIRRHDEFKEFFSAVEKLRAHALEAETKKREAIKRIDRKIEEIKDKLLPQDFKIIDELKEEIKKIE